MRKQREKEDYWDKYEDYNLESNFDETDYNKSSLDLPCFNIEKKEITRNNKREKGIH